MANGLAEALRQFPTIASFVAHLVALPAELEAAQHRGEAEAGEVLVEHARDMIGTEIREWPALADSTVQEKARLGYTGRISATDPLYRTGEMRLSISYRIEGRDLLLGSTDPVAPFHEFGTSKMPARPFIGATMFVRGREVSDLIAGYIVAAIAGDRPPTRRRP